MWPITSDTWTPIDWMIYGFGLCLAVDLVALPCWWLIRFISRVVKPPVS